MVSWSSVGNTGVLGDLLFSIHVDSNDIVYVGGNFTGVDDISIRNIATWNGTTWGTLGNTGTVGAVFNEVRTITTDVVDNILVEDSTQYVTVTEYA